MSAWFWAKAEAMLGADAVWRRQIVGSSVRLSIRVGASALLGAALLVSSQPALAQFTQQGSKLVGTGAAGAANQGRSVAVSADGNTAIVGAQSDNGGIGAAWVYTRSGGAWSPQGSKLVGTGYVGTAVYQGASVALSADGNTAIVGGFNDNYNTGAAWIFTRSGVTWTQQGLKLVGNDAAGGAQQGRSVALSSDGNTAIVGGYSDNAYKGAAWVFTRSGTDWTQQGSKLVGTNVVGNSEQGESVALSADGNTAIVGGYNDGSTGAVWVYTRSLGVWSPQGDKLVGTDAVGSSYQGKSVALSDDGNTAMVGGYNDNGGVGAVWVFTRSGVTWTQQGLKLIGTGAVPHSTGNRGQPVPVVAAAYQGISVALSADGNTAIVGGMGDNGYIGAAWVYTRSGTDWSQQGSKLVASDYVGAAQQGVSVALSSDGRTAIVGGQTDNTNIGAAWVYVQPPLPQLQLTPATNIASSGPPGGPFSPTSFDYSLSATSGSVDYSITGIPSWLTASFTSGTATTSPVTDTFSLTNVGSLNPGTYNATISFTNTTNGLGNTTRTATLTVTAAVPEEACAVVPNTLSSPEAGRPEFSIPDPCARPRAR